MSTLRNAYLDVLGIDRWVARGAPAEALDAQEVEVAPMARQEQSPVARHDPLPMAGVDAQPAARRENVIQALRVSSPAQGGPLSGDWAGLRDQIAACTACDQLCRTRTQTVFGVGNQQAEWLIIGEAPGAEEDRQGEPFVGRAGQLLNAMLLAIGLPRETVFIANVLKCRPPANRDPRPEEVSNCLPFLSQQIALLKPKIMLAVGRIAAQNLLATDAPLARLRGKVHRFGEHGTPLVITYHPAYLLRTPSDKRKAWEDLKFARAAYRQISGQISGLGVGGNP
jgi:uracil-DNA glycosylase